MPEDGIQLDALLNEAAGGEPAQEPAQEPTTQEPVQEPAPEQPAQEPTQEPTQEEPKAEDPNKSNTAKEEPAQNKNKSNPMKEVRDKLNAEQKSREKIEAAVQRFTNGDYDFKLKDFKTEDGKIDYDALIEAMDKKDTERRASEHGITPEVQAEIERIEKEKIELQKERLKVAMDRAVSNMQIDLNLDKNAVNQFFADSLALKKNPYQWLAQGGTLEDLYYLIYRETLTKSAVDKAVADAKAEWEKANSNVPPTSNPAKPATNTSSNDTLSLDALLNLAANKK